ncbi:MAG: hypothetical protein KAI66_17895 [Lentisphaeria bacterium]|nr:hypothetical protein [Lentisphaeria bacterium]
MGRHGNNVPFSTAQPYWQLPIEFADRNTGYSHEGTHMFLVNDFVRSVAANRLPPNHVWQAARYNMPGIVAHGSARCDGEKLAVPDFGTPSPNWASLVETQPPCNRDETIIPLPYRDRRGVMGGIL